MNCIKLIFFVYLAFCSSFAFAEDAGKIYIDQEAIQFIDNLIIIHTENGSIRVDALYRDNNGLFILPQDINPLSKRWPKTICNNKHTYDLWMITCPFCEKEERQLFEIEKEHCEK